MDCDAHEADVATNEREANEEEMPHIDCDANEADVAQNDWDAQDDEIAELPVIVLTANAAVIA